MPDGERMSDGGRMPDRERTPERDMTGKVELTRGLRRVQALSLALGCIIGFGCFVLPGDFLARAGPVGATAGVVLGGAAMLIIARSYGVMLSRFPVAGGAFAYAYHAAGRYHAALCGWMLAIGYLSIVPLNATALAVLGKFIAPRMFARGYMYSIAGFDVFAGEVLLASAAIIVVGFFQLRRVRDVGGFQLALTALLVAAVLVVGAGTAVADTASLANLRPAFTPDRSALAAVLGMLALAPWLYVGFDTLPQAAEEFDFPPRQGRRLMSGAIAAGACMYVIVIVATAVVVPWRDLLESGTTWATGTAVQASIGTAGLAVLTVAICMAVLTGINGFYMASSRLLFSMGRAHVLPVWFTKLHPERRIPYNAILFTGAVSLIAPWLGRQVILWIVEVSAFGVAVGYLYTCFAAYARSADARSADEPAHRWRALLGMFLSAGFLVLLTVPGMPAFMAAPSWIALIAWLTLGGVLFLTSARRYRAASGDELDRLILGSDSSMAR